ncbi:MAG: FKBP-type peptidyl-prolyl cis-trans isomerase [bacterium]|nr:FKBP-type peptidyl-prolyl cis-trans isomerase [bacterium]
MLRRILNLFRGSNTPAFELPQDDVLTTTPSGLRYVILAEGSGDSPAATNRVKVRYAGWLESGRAFDASYPGTASFPLDRVIQGWTEGLQLLKPGGSAKFVIPPDLAYGARGAPPLIGPGATLVFHVDLVSVGG